MNFISRLRFYSPHPHIKTLLTPRLTSRSYALAAKQVGGDDEEEELEMIDQRRLPADYDPSTFDPTEHRSPPTDRVFRLIDQVTSLTLLEVAQLVSIIMKRLRMDAPPVIGVMKPGAAAAGLAGIAAKGSAAKEEVKAEKMVFEVKLESFEASAKIKIIKEVRSFTELGLKEAKELVEKAPAVVKAGVSKEEGQQIVEKLKALGAKVVLE